MARKVFLDTDLLSSFLWIGKTNYLKKVLPDYEILVPYQVTLEIKRPVPGLKALQNKYYGAKANGDFKEERDFEAPSDEYREYLRLTHGIGFPKTIGSGEAAGIVLAKKYQGVLASNNLSDIAYFVARFGIACITTCDILLALLDQSILTEKELSKVYSDMLEHKRMLPYPTFSELLKARTMGQYKANPIP